ncbi:hypothetical protein D3C84_1086800 [compost metagenome]
MKMLKQFAINGTMSANQVFTQLKPFTTKYSGITILSNGTIISAMMAVRITLLPLKLSLASAYPQRELTPKPLIPITET